MSRNTKYVVYILVLFFSFTVAYSALSIYNNKYKHDGGSFSLIDLITGKNSTSSKLKNTAEAIQTANLHTEYNAKAPTVSPATINENIYRAVVLNFYEDYLDNKQASHSQDTTLAKYGTENLAVEYKTATASYDPILCGSSSPGSTVITSSSTADGKWYYNLEFSDSTGTVAVSQAVIVNQGGKNLIDNVTCPGPV